jgi:hypothetical protein
MQLGALLKSVAGELEITLFLQCGQMIKDLSLSSSITVTPVLT